MCWTMRCISGCEIYSGRCAELWFISIKVYLMYQGDAHSLGIYIRLPKSSVFYSILWKIDLPMPSTAQTPSHVYVTWSLSCAEHSESWCRGESLISTNSILNHHLKDKFQLCLKTESVCNHWRTSGRCNPEGTATGPRDKIKHVGKQILRRASRFEV